MAWLVIDEYEQECIISNKPLINKNDKNWKGYWKNFYIDIIKLPNGSIKKLIGRDLNYDDEPVEIK